MRTLVVANTQNRKTGPMAAVYRSQESCPTTCPLMGSGCYAEHGAGGGGPFRLADRHGSDDLGKLRALRHTMPRGGWLRLNVSGDFLTDDGTPDAEYIDAVNHLARKRPDVRILAYTHAWRILTPDTFAFVVNASCETPAELAEAQSAGWPTVLADTGGDTTLIGSAPGGRRVIQCPAETRDGVTCARCGACGVTTRTRPTIAFVAHGSRRKVAARTILTARQENRA